MAEPKFQRNEFYETLLRMKRDQPRRYDLNVSSGMQVCVQLYERAKMQASAMAA
jgi:hypothetical protein